MKVLVFGSTGNCGKYISQKYLERGHSVIGVGRSEKPFEHKNFEYIQGDISTKKLYEKLPTDADVAINLAGVQPSILPTSEQTDLEATISKYMEVNIIGTFMVLEFLRKSNINTYVYTTSHRDYELYWPAQELLGNNLPPAINYSGDHTMYAISKTTGKMMGDYYGEAFGFRTFNLRLPMIFLLPDTPYYLSHGKPTMMPFLNIIKQAMAGQELEVWGNPDMVRDYVHIDNLVFLIDACIRSDLNKGTFNVGTGEAVSTATFIKTIKEIFDQDNKCAITFRPDKNTYKSAIYDISEQVDLLDYQPVLLREMLEKIRDGLKEKNLNAYWGSDL